MYNRISSLPIHSTIHITKSEIFSRQLRNNQLIIQARGFVVRVPMDTSLPFLPWFYKGRLLCLCMVWLVEQKSIFPSMIKAFLTQPTASWSSCSMYFINHSIHSPPKQCFLTLTMCPEFSVHQISQLIITMSTHKVCYLNFARLLHRTNSTPTSTVGHLLLVSLCMRIIAKLDIQPLYACICVDITRAGARY